MLSAHNPKNYKGPPLQLGEPSEPRARGKEKMRLNDPCSSTTAYHQALCR
jgi:hypothetical protein